MDSDSQTVGCILYIQHFDERFKIESIIWNDYIKNSGLMKKYRDNILSRRVLGHQLEFIFDSEVNCFEVLRLIKDQSLNGPLLGGKSVERGISKIKIHQYGMEAVLVKVEAYKNPVYFNLADLREHLESFGLVIYLDRDKIDGVNTGIIYAIMMLDKEEDLYTNGAISESEFRPGMFPLWTTDTTTKIYERFMRYINTRKVKNMNNHEE